MIYFKELEEHHAEKQKAREELVQLLKDLIISVESCDPKRLSWDCHIGDLPDYRAGKTFPSGRKVELNITVI